MHAMTRAALLMALAAVMLTIAVGCGGGGDNRLYAVCDELDPDVGTTHVPLGDIPKLVGRDYRLGPCRRNEADTKEG
jgi:hypothetical protein